MSRLKYLDSTRGIASFMVVFSHLIGAIQWDFFNMDTFIKYCHPIYFGEGAVCYFFVLSGFVLTIPFHSKKIDFIYCIKFCLARFFRIYPLFLFTLILSFLYVKFFASAQNSILLTEWFKGVYASIATNTSWNTLFHNFNLFRNTATSRYVPQDWTLSIELTISIFSVVFFALSIISPEIMLILGWFGVKQIGLSSFIFPFLLGAYLYSRKVELTRIITKFSILKYVLPVISFALFYNELILSKELSTLIDKILISGTAWGATGLLLVVLASPSLQKILSHKFLVFIGEISYSIYLIHFLIIFAFIGYATTGLNLFLISASILFITVAFSYYTYIGIERPFINLSKKLLNIIERRLTLILKK